MRERTVSPLRQRFPFGGLLVAAVLGILGADFLPRSPLPGAGCVLAFLLFLFVAGRGFRGRDQAWASALAAVFAGFALIHWWGWQEAPGRLLAEWMDRHPGEYRVEGIICREPKSTHSGSLSFPLQLESIEPPPGDGTGEILHPPVTVQVRWEGGHAGYGDRVAFRATPSRPPFPRNPGAMDYRGWLERQDIFTVFRVDPSQPGSVISQDHGNPVLALAIRAGKSASRILGIDLEGDPETVAAIRGICLGVTENAPEGFIEGFRVTGTMHLFSVSGLHVGMVAVILWFVLRLVGLPRPWAIAAAIPSIFFYVAVTGMKSGSLRAATMSSILMIGLVFFRRSPPVNVLAASAFVQLAADTNALFSPGWQFSYAVVLAILLLAPSFQRVLVSLHRRDEFLPSRLLTRAERVRFAFWAEVSTLLAVSAAAWVGSFLPTLAYFHLVSFSALGANLLAVPLAFAVLSLGMLSLLTGGLLPWVAGAFNNANWALTKVLLLVVHGSALLPGGHWFAGTPPKPWPEMIVPDLRGGSCAVIRDGFSTAILDTGRKKDAERVILPMLESLGVNRIGSLVVTSSSAAHLGGVPAIGKEIPLGRVFLPSDAGRSTVARNLRASWRDAGILHAGEEIQAGRHVSLRVVETSGEKVVLKVRLGSLYLLWIPEADAPLLDRLGKLSDGELRSDLLYLPLGGARIEESLRLIRRISPGAVITPSGGLSREGFPSREWERLLRELGVALFSQDETGAVIIDADPNAPGIRSFLPGEAEMKLRTGRRGTPPPP